MSSLIGEMEDFLNRWLRLVSNIALNQAYHGEALDCCPYQQFIDMLKRVMERAEQLRDHDHVWGEDGFCVECGFDGNA